MRILLLLPLLLFGWPMGLMATWGPDAAFVDISTPNQCLRVVEAGLRDGLLQTFQQWSGPQARARVLGYCDKRNSGIDIRGIGRGSYSSEVYPSSNCRDCMFIEFFHRDAHHPIGKGGGWTHTCGPNHTNCRYRRYFYQEEGEARPTAAARTLLLLLGSATMGSKVVPSGDFSGRPLGAEFEVYNFGDRPDRFTVAHMTFPGKGFVQGGGGIHGHIGHFDMFFPDENKLRIYRGGKLVRIDPPTGEGWWRWNDLRKSTPSSPAPCVGSENVVSW